MKAKPKSTAPCSAAEYESLPEPLQRKCFSSLERLRIAEQQARRQGVEGQHYSHAHPASARTLSIHRSLTLGSSRRRLRKAESRRQDQFVAQADAQFFLSLPEKVQRCAFSREEQVLLAVGRCDHPSPLPPTELSPSHEPDQRFADFQFDFYDEDSDSDQERGRSRRRLSSASFASDVSPTRHSPYRPQQELSQDSESTLLYLDTMSPPPARLMPPSTYKRTMSLTNLPIRHSTSSAPHPVDLPVSARANASWHQRAHSQSVSGRRSSHTPTLAAPVYDAEATHYRDPEARKKLRMYLASPQKFDEAVEFGFPSQTGTDSTKPAQYQLPPIATDARNFSRDMQTFLKDDKVSFLEDNEEEDKGLTSDGDSVADMDSPVTPSSVGQSFRYHTRHQSSNISSLDSNGLPPIHPMTGRLNREMTLRMTLTRSDLRADEEQLYGWQGQRGSKDDPFALEELQLTDDMNGTKSPFYVKPKSHGNLVSRLFKRASKKGR